MLQLQQEWDRDKTVECSRAVRQSPSLLMLSDMILVSTPGFTWQTWVSDAPTSAWMCSVASFMQWVVATQREASPRSNAMCLQRTSGRWRRPWRCPGAATPVQWWMVGSWSREVTLTTLTLARCACMTLAKTAGRIRPASAPQGGGTAQCPFWKGSMSWGGLSWGEEPKGSTFSLWSVTALTRGNGVMWHHFRRELVQLVPPPLMGKFT